MKTTCLKFSINTSSTPSVRMNVSDTRKLDQTKGARQSWSCSMEYSSFVYVYECHLWIMRYMSLAYHRHWLRRPKGRLKQKIGYVANNEYCHLLKISLCVVLLMTSKILCWRSWTNGMKMTLTQFLVTAWMKCWSKLTKVQYNDLHWLIDLFSLFWNGFGYTVQYSNSTVGTLSKLGRRRQ